MKSIFAAGITAMALGFAGTSAAEENAAPFYIHLEKAGLELIEYSSGGSIPGREAVDADAWQGRFGYVLNENFSVEVGYSQSEEDVAGDTQSFGIALVRAGADGATTVPFTNVPVNIYAMLGKSFGEVNLSDGRTQDLEGFAAGVGFGLQLTTNLEIAVDWLTYGEDNNLPAPTAADVSSFRLAGFGLGIRMGFGGGGESDDGW